MTPHHLNKTDAKASSPQKSTLPKRVRHGLLFGLAALALAACSSGPSSSAAPSPVTPPSPPGPGGETTYTVTFDANGGAPVPAAQTITNDADNTNANLVVEPPAPAKDGYRFLGWVDKSTISTNVSAPSPTTNYFTFTNTPIGSDLTLLAQWELKTYLVSFIDAGDFKASNQQIKHGRTVAIPSPNPSKPGNRFQNWYADPAFSATFKFDTAITSNTKIYARWEAARLLVSFDLQGGTAAATITARTVDYGSKIAQPTTTLTRTGYTFTGWYTDRALNKKFTFATDTITAATTLYAGWKLSEYVVSFNTGGGSAVNSQTIFHGQKATKPANPVRASFIFENWYKTAALSTVFNFATETITADTTLFAKWTAARTVSFITNSETPDAPAYVVQTVPINGKATQPGNPIRTGKYFVNWFTTAATNTVFNFDTARITVNTNVYAGWGDSGVIVTFNTGGGSAVAEQRFIFGQKATRPAVNPTSNGYAFLGWYATAGAVTAATPTFNFDTALTADTTIYAKWIKTYAVTFVTNVGNPNLAVQTVRQGSNAVKPATDPTRIGFRFEGWFRDTAGTQLFSFTGESITKDTTLYAKWGQKTYTVTFVTNRGAPNYGNPQTVNHGNRPTQPSDPVAPTGFTFGGWYANSDFSGNKFNFATDSITAVTTLYAKWNRNSYTVAFNSRGGSAIANQNVLYTNTVTQPSNPTQTGYTFAGWYKDSKLEQRFDFNTKITAALTLYAKWTLNRYVVTLNLDGGALETAGTEQNIDHGNKATKPGDDPKLAGHTFAGWFTTAATNVAFNFNNAITGPTTIYAAWTRNTYTVTFNTDGGSAVAAQRVLYTNKATEPAEPTRSRYGFLGWFTTAATNVVFDFNTTLIKSNTTIYAGWGLNIKRVTFIANNGSAGSVQRVVSNNLISPPTPPTRTGYTFAGWYKDIGLSTQFVFATEKVREDTTLYAKWEKKRYSVSFNSAGGSAVPAQQIPYQEKASVPSPPSREGHSLVGWYTTAATNTAFNFNTAITNAITLYAAWKRLTYTVSFEENSGTPKLGNQFVLYTNRLPRPGTVKRSGFTFAGWFWENGFATRFNFDRDVIKSNTTLYAKWVTGANAFTVTFQANGGSTPAVQIVGSGDRVPQPADPTRSGYSFDGWFKDSGLSSQFVFATDRVTANLTLYAKWVRTFTVRFATNAAGSLVAWKTQVLRTNSKLVKPMPDPELTGFKFAGWFWERALTTGVNFATGRIASNTTLYAKWADNTYTVAFQANGGSASAVQTVAPGDKALRPADPARTGFTFGGWYEEAALSTEFNFDTKLISKDTTLYAKWTIKEYRVTFITNLGTDALLSDATQVVKYSSNAAKPAPDPTRPPVGDRGYQFGGWYADAALSSPFSFATTPITGDTKLYARWLNTSKVSFVTNNAGAEWTNQYVVNNTGRVVQPKPDPKRTDFDFAGWFKNLAGTQSFNFNTERISAPTTLYAKWSKNVFTVAFNTGDGTAVAAQTVASGDKATQPAAPTSNGYAFLGWYGTSGAITAATPTFNFDTTQITKDTDVYARWIKTFTVSFATNAAGGTVALWPGKAQTVRQGSNAAAPSPAPTRSGYTFNQWYKNAALTQLFSFTGEPITANLTLYAKWTIKRYAVTFERNGATSSAPPVQNVNHGSVATKPSDPTRTGHRFGGWYVNSDLSGSAFSFSSPITAATTLYAKWERQSYTVTFDSTGGILTNTQQVLYTNKVTPPSDPVRGNHVFLGWFKDSGTSQAFNFATERITNATRIYAKWRLTSGPSFATTDKEPNGSDTSSPYHSDDTPNNMGGIGFYNNEAYVMAGKLNNRLFRVSNNGDRVIVNDGTTGFTGGNREFYSKPLGIRDGYAYLAKRKEDLTLPFGSAVNAQIVRVSLTSGQVGFFSDDLSVGDDLRRVAGIAVTNNSTKAYVLDDRNGWKVWEVDLATGNRTVVSDPAPSGRGSGPDFADRTPHGIALYKGAAYVISSGLSIGNLLKVDLSTGNREEVKAFRLVDDFGLPNSTAIKGLALYNDKAYLVGGDKLLEVTLSGGAVRTVTSGGGFRFQYIAIHNGVAYVTDSSQQQVLQVNLTTGARTVFSK